VTQLTYHFFQLDRFAEIIVHPYTEAFFFVAFHGISRQRDDDLVRGESSRCLRLRCAGIAGYLAAVFEPGQDMPGKVDDELDGAMTAKL
jgi:hypothetical protein